MKKRTVENLLKQAKEITAPESVWEKIENEQIIVKPESTKTKTKTKIKTRYPAIASLAACAAVCALTLAMINQKRINNTPGITAELTTDNSKVSSQTQNEEVKDKESENITLQHQNTSENQTTTKSEIETNTQSTQTESTSTQGNGSQASGISVPFFRVWNHNFYKIVDLQISESDLDKLYTQVINGNETTVFSRKGKSIDECFVWKANDEYHYYKCIYKGIFNFNGKNYGLESPEKYVNPEKGKYLGEVDGIKVYEFVGNDNAILVDMAPVIGWGDSEELYVATLIE